MSDIYVSHTGNGTAYVDNPSPNFGELFTLYAIPNAPDTLEDIVARDENGHYIAMDPTLEQQTLRYREEWGSFITIDVSFSNITPPPPPPAPNITKLIAIIKQKDMYFIPNLK